MTFEEQDERSGSVIRVLLVDEEVVIRAGLRILIDSWPVSQVVGEADGPAEALAALDVIKPTLIVCSHTGRANGYVSAIRSLIEGAGRIPVVLLTGSRNRQVGALAAQVGARWIVSKKHAVGALREALERVHSGEEWTDKPAVLARTAEMDHHSRGNNHGSDPDQRLTSREREVAVLVSQGCTNRQVGSRLGITEITVRHHLTSIFSKLRIANRFELIAWLYRHGIVSPLV